MMKKTLNNGRKTIGFFPLFYNLAETGRAVLIARECQNRGMDIVFFSHGGKYEYLVEPLDCDIVHVAPRYSKEFIDLLWKSSRLETLRNPFSVTNLRYHVKEEIKAFKEAGVDLVVSTNNWPCRISAPAANIPLIFVTPKVIPHFSKFPEDAEFFLSYLLPNKIKLSFINWYAPKSKMYVKSFAKVANEYGINPPRYTSDINHGDYTFYTNDVKLLGEKRVSISPDERFIGPISIDSLFQKQKDQEAQKVQTEIEDHIIKTKRSILLTLGSSGTKTLFLKLLNVFQKTNYQVVAVYADILSQKDLPSVTENILLKRFVPSIARINRLVDLAIIHGGEGTVLTAAYSGKPVIGFPMQFEQHLNLEMLVRKGAGVIASKKMSGSEIKDLIEDVFSEYHKYHSNAKKIATSLSPPKGHIKAAALIEQLLEHGRLNDQS